MKQIDYDGRTLQVPEALEELTPQQYLRYLEIALMLQAGQIKPVQARVKLLTLLLQLPVDAAMMPRSQCKKLAALVTLTGPFVQKREGVTRLDTCTGMNLLPQWQRRKGPGDMLNGISFGAFIRCSGWLAGMNALEGEEREEAVARVAGELYPGEGRLPVLVQTHACLFFLNVLEILRTEPLEMNGCTVDYRILFQESTKKVPAKGPSVGWTGVAMDLAELGVFGTYQQVLDAPMWDVFTFLYHKQRQG